MKERWEQRVFGGPDTRTYHIIFALATCGMALALLGIPGVIIAARFLPVGVVHVVALFILAWAVLSDLTAVYFWVTCLLREGGFHQDPFGALGYYVVFVGWGMQGAAWWWRVAALAVLAAFHVECQWYLGERIARRLGWRQNYPGKTRD